MMKDNKRNITKRPITPKRQYIGLTAALVVLLLAAAAVPGFELWHNYPEAAVGPEPPALFLDTENKQAANPENETQTIPEAAYKAVSTKPDETAQYHNQYEPARNEPPGGSDDTPKTAEITENREIRAEFAVLREKYGNNDIVGRLRIPGTAINYLVTQAADNCFYLNHNIHKNRCDAGQIFLDYAVDLSKDNHNTVIYGHNMRAGNKFHNLRFFANYEFFRQNTVIYFDTIYEQSQWEIFAFYTAHISFPYTHINLGTNDQWALVLNSFAAASAHTVTIELTPSDRVLTLSTCTGAAIDTRYVLHARRVDL